VPRRCCFSAPTPSLSCAKPRTDGIDTLAHVFTPNTCMQQWTVSHPRAWWVHRSIAGCAKATYDEKVTASALFSPLPFNVARGWRFGVKLCVWCVWGEGNGAARGPQGCWVASSFRKAAPLAYFTAAALSGAESAGAGGVQGDLVDGGQSLTQGGMMSYTHDVLYVSMFLQVATTLLSDWFFLVLLLVCACACPVHVACVPWTQRERVHLGSHGRWKGPRLQTNPECDQVAPKQFE
jgi:hypothetical protein